MKIREKFLTTGIGSLPYLDAFKAVDKIYSCFDIAFWPQLPKKGFKENMYVQFAEGMPNLVIDEKNKRAYIDTSRDFTEGLENIYEAYISENYNRFAVKEEFSAGFYAFLSKTGKEKRDYVKGHITGPVSFGLSVPDEKGKAIIYNDILKDALIKLLELKAVWQIDMLQNLAESVIIFIDEPYLTSFGSSFVNIERHDIVSILNAVITKIHKRGALAAIHCCGNTDWPMLIDTDIDIINFDAYSYMDSFLLYAESINKFLKRGGYLAWGIVPTSEKAFGESAQAIFEKLSLNIENLGKRSIDRGLLLTNSLLTPSCGMGTLSEILVEDILGKLNAVSDLAKRKL
jgi:hypothetical protein